jgi:ABC-type transport system involved in cytochrome c biogenesis permease component
MITLLTFVPFALLAQETPEYQPPQVSPMVWVIYLVIIVLCIAGMWKTFSKAGQPGWAAIIPIYCWIVWCKVAGRPAWWFLLLLVCLPVFYIILSIDTAKRFGKGGGFAVGLILLPFIFWPMLGFGSAQYQGAPAAA